MATAAASSTTLLGPLAVVAEAAVLVVDARVLGRARAVVVAVRVAVHLGPLGVAAVPEGSEVGAHCDGLRAGG